MKKILFLTIITLFLVIPLTMSALFEHNIGVNLKTHPNTDVVLRFQDVESESIFKSLPITTDSTGNARVMLETDRDEVMVLVCYLKNKTDFLKDGNILTMEVVGPYETDRAITIDMNQIMEERNAPEETEEVEENETIEEEVIPEETEEVEEIEEEGNLLTGAQIFGGESFFSSKTTYYGIGIAFLLVAGFFGFRKYKSKGSKEIKVKKLSELKEEQEEASVNNKAIEDAERKIKEAQEEIRRIKNQDKIVAAKKKLIEDQKALMRLREGKE